MKDTLSVIDWSSALEQAVSFMYKARNSQVPGEMYFLLLLEGFKDRMFGNSLIRFKILILQVHSLCKQNVFIWQFLYLGMLILHHE